MDAIRDAAHRSLVLLSPCLDGRARSPVPRRFSRERFRPRLGTITHRQAGQIGGRQATQQVLAVHAGSPSEAQQIRIRAAGMDRRTSKLHTTDCLVRSLPACPRRRRPVRGARVHRRWTSYCTSDGAAPAGPPNTRHTDSSSHVELVLGVPGARRAWCTARAEAGAFRAHPQCELRVQAPDRAGAGRPQPQAHH